jgi:hypothetical protein
MERRTVKKQITQKVTKKDQAAKHDRLVEVDRELLQVASEKAESNSDFNGQLKSLRKEQKALLDVIDSGEETLDVDCYEVPDEARMEMTYRRVDNDVELPEFTRPFTADERQMNFDYLAALDDDQEPSEDPDDSEPEDEVAQ